MWYESVSRVYCVLFSKQANSVSLKQVTQEGFVSSFGMSYCEEFQCDTFRNLPYQEQIVNKLAEFFLQDLAKHR